MKKKKIVIATVLACIFISVIAVMLATTKPNKNPSDDPISLVASSVTAKFEYRYEADGKYKTVDSEIWLLTSYFSNIDIVAVDANFDEDWVYRITFNWNHVSMNKIIVLVSQDSMKIGDSVYTANINADFAGIFNAIEGKYAYFDF